MGSSVWLWFIFKKFWRCEQLFFLWFDWVVPCRNSVNFEQQKHVWPRQITYRKGGQKPCVYQFCFEHMHQIGIFCVFWICLTLGFCTSKELSSLIFLVCASKNFNIWGFKCLTKWVIFQKVAIFDEWYKMMKCSRLVECFTRVINDLIVKDVCMVFMWGQSLSTILEFGKCSQILWSSLCAIWSPISRCRLDGCIWLKLACCAFCPYTVWLSVFQFDAFWYLCLLASQITMEPFSLIHPGVCAEPGGILGFKRKMYKGPYHPGGIVIYDCNQTKTCQRDGTWKKTAICTGNNICIKEWQRTQFGDELTLETCQLLITHTTFSSSGVVHDHITNCHGVNCDVSFALFTHCLYNLRDTFARHFSTIAWFWVLITTIEHIFLHWGYS